MKYTIHYLIISYSACTILFSCGEPSITTGVDGPIYVARRTDSAPQIDGILTDECWKIAETAPLVRSSDGGRPSFPTNVRALWDDDRLYLAFECQDSDASGTVSGRDGPVLSEDHVSCYIDADADTSTGLLVAVSPTGAVFDAFICSDRYGGAMKTLADWNCGEIRASVTVYGGGARPGTEDRFWTVELSLPLAEFFTAPHIPPLPGDMWRVNFHRRDITGEPASSSFVPTGSDGGYHPQHCAWLQFGGI